MSRVHKISNLVGVVVPFLAFVVAIVLLWSTWVDWSDLAVLAIMYVVTGYGVTLGFHRLLTHRSFQTFKPVERLKLAWNVVEITPERQRQKLA